MRTGWILSGLLCLPALAFAQLAPEKAAATFTVADGLQFELFAAEPLLVNPTAIDIDHLGRVWVAEAVNYRRKNFGRPILRPEGDRIVILTDKDGDGKADDATVFYQGPELYGPLSVAVVKEPTGPGYKVLVAQSPDILLFADKDGDGKADGKPTKLLTGFGGFDHDHGVHGLTFGPDGKLYFTVGDAGVKNLQAADGQGPKWSSNTTDCRAGTVWRCEPDGTKLELIAHNFRNNYEATVDSFGNVFLSDNDDDGNQQTRICYVLPGGNYGYHPRGPGQSHWHEEQPGIVHKILRTYFGSPTGMCMYEGTLLPEKYRGFPLHTDAGPRHVRSYLLKPNGAGFDVERQDIVTSTDNWFRPSDVCVAPDGSVFVADWYDPGVGGHGMGDYTRGRIYRLSPKGYKGYSVTPAKVDSVAGALAALNSPNVATRHLAYTALVQLDKAAVKTGVAEQFSAQDDTARSRAYWLAARLGADTFAAAPKTWPNDPRYAALAVRINQDYAGLIDAKNPLFAGNLITAAREQLLALRLVPAEQARAKFYELAKLYNGKDQFYLSALNIACGTDAKRRATILADFDKHFPDWNDATANLVWELRPASVLPRLEKMLSNPKLDPRQAGRIIDIVAASDSPDAFAALLDLLLPQQPAEVRSQAVQNLKLHLAGKWRDKRNDHVLCMATNTLLNQSATRAEALILIAATEQTDFVNPLVLLINHALTPANERRELVRVLGKLPGAQATAALEKLLTAPAPINLDAIAALGEQIPKNVGKNDKPSPALERLKALVLDAKQTSPARTAAVTALGTTRPGATWLLEAHAQKQLAAELIADAGRLLRNSPHQDLRNKALIAFPVAGKLDPAKLPALSALAQRTGNLARGKELLAASLKAETQCLKCHMVRGVGGQVGPDLSMIGKKASKENLYESILYPSKAIADQFVTWSIETTKGQVLQGLLVQETETTLTLRDANGKDWPIGVKDIESKVKGPKSLMPENLVVQLTEDDLVDVVEYLYTLKTQALTPDSWHIVGPFANDGKDNGLETVVGPEADKKFNPAAVYPGKGGSVGWKTIKPDGTGYVDLAAHYGNQSTQIVSYVYQQIESSADQEVTLTLGTDDGAKLWVNGTQVHQSRSGRAAAPEQDSVKVKLTKGTNTLWMKIANGSNPHGFYLTVLAEQDIKLAGK
jgi:putative membrane-bound dehydrogenase-like protein